MSAPSPSVVCHALSFAWPDGTTVLDGLDRPQCGEGVGDAEQVGHGRAGPQSLGQGGGDSGRRHRAA